MMKSLAIIGAGRVGRALGRSLREAGWKIILVTARTEASAKKAARFVGGGRAIAGLPATLTGASVILLSVPDDALSPVAEDLARTIKGEWKGKVVLHTSGALDMSVLGPLRASGAITGSVHPLQTFNGLSVPPLEGKVFAIQGDDTATRVARRIARTLGGIAVTIPAEKKPLYHAAGAFGAGLVLALEESGAQLLMRTGLKRREARRALLALTRQVLDSYEKLGAQKAWTGPLARGDYGVVAVHEKALADAGFEFLAAYRAASRLAARVLSHDPEAMLRELDKISGQQQVAKAKGD
ncbi:MAG TPA: DUF2520 domain-containing protein [Methylomirabilota bacterium]|nr:DUF2520 domain-containing protein [Methylomirabilota bacterium]